MDSMRVAIPLDGKEFLALSSMATAECRTPREQLRFLLREEARGRGLLPMESQEASLKGTQSHASAAR